MAFGSYIADVRKILPETFKAKGVGVASGGVPVKIEKSPKFDLI